MTIYIIQWLYSRHNGDPECSVFTNRHEAQAFALELLQDLNVTDEELAEHELSSDTMWNVSYWWLYTSSRREDNIYVSFETATINLPTETKNV